MKSIRRQNLLLTLESRYLKIEQKYELKNTWCCNNIVLLMIFECLETISRSFFSD